jgi:hypothetical protein
MPIGITAAAASGIAKGAAASSAANAAQSAANKSAAFQHDVYSGAQGNLQPTIPIGNQAGGALAGLLGIGGDRAASNTAWNNYRNSTNYNFLLSQGLRGASYSNAPAYGSGGFAKNLNNYAQGMAGNALGGYEQLLAGEQGLGVNAASSLGGIGANLANTNANTNAYAGNAKANAALYGGNAFSNAFSDLNNLYQQNLSQSSFGF